MLTEQQVLDALESETAEEFFDNFDEAVGAKIHSIMEQAHKDIAMKVIMSYRGIPDLASSINAAQWSAFSTGWTLRGLVDGED